MFPMFPVLFVTFLYKFVSLFTTFLRSARYQALYGRCRASSRRSGIGGGEPSRSGYLARMVDRASTSSTTANVPFYAVYVYIG